MTIFDTTLSRQIDMPMTMTGEEKRMAVESPRGRRVNEVKIKAIRKPPETAIPASMALVLEIQISTFCSCHIDLDIRL